VNNAGLFSAVGPVWEVDPEAWWRDVEVSLRGTFLCSRAALRSMVPDGGGRILNVVSLSGTRPSPHATGYACAKAGVFRLTEGLAEEAGPYGVRVFSIGPGFVRTAMTSGVIETDRGRWLPEMAEVPAGAWVGPERVADLVVVIATGRADALSGRFLYALDDVEDLIRRADEIRQEDLYTVRLLTPELMSSSPTGDPGEQSRSPLVLRRNRQ
jgi:NAD(P)-dependent dehydrogenase (short-subunit alcohol dehydrogenase family)